MVSQKLKTSGMFNLNFELEIQKKDPNFIFFWVILISIDSSFKYTQWSHKFSISQSYSLLIYLWRCMEN